MQPITEYIKAHSNGARNPVTGARIADAMCISGIDVRAMINKARSSGEHICSAGADTTIQRTRAMWSVRLPLYIVVFLSKNKRLTD